MHRPRASDSRARRESAVQHIGEPSSIRLHLHQRAGVSHDRRRTTAQDEAHASAGARSALSCFCIRGKRQRPVRYRLPCNSGAPAVIARTRGALLLSCTQASVAEFRRETLAPDERQASAPAPPCTCFREERARLPNTCANSRARPLSFDAVARRVLSRGSRRACPPTVGPPWVVLSRWSSLGGPLWRRPRRRPASGGEPASHLGFRGRAVHRFALDGPSSTCQINLAGQPRHEAGGPEAGRRQAGGGRA